MPIKAHNYKLYILRSMLTIEQIRAARALLDWSQSDLAEHAGLSQTGIARIENGTNKPNSSTLVKIQTAFDSGGVEFIGTSGVKKRSGEIRTLSGATGFIDFMHDVYQGAVDFDLPICLHNAKPDNWFKWMGEEEYLKHSKRMVELTKEKTIDVRITALEGDQNFIASNFAEYRWLPADKFNDQSFYAYGDKLAFLTFSEDAVDIKILQNLQFANGFRVLFNNAWETVARIPPNKEDAA